MVRDKRDVIQVLETELRFLNTRGYDEASRHPWGVPLIFEESPTCPNANDRTYAVACSDCVLTRFVPVQRLSEKVPCRHIPLNDAGETVDTLYRGGNLEDAKLVLRKWLTKAIRTLKENRARLAPHRIAEPSYHVPEGT